jgi:ABC-2 type transport system ATP-binding protein
VRGVDVTVGEGEIVGFLGPNGAGKTTTMRMLTTLLAPTAGSGTVAGCDLLADPVGVRRRIGYVAQSGVTQPEALVGEELVDHARMFGIRKEEARRRGHLLLGQLDLDGLWSAKCSTLSGGQRRRLDIAMGLINEPRLLFLDEPSTGLDPQSRANLWEHITRLRATTGTTVFITTHYMDEADALCDRVIVIDDGAVAASGTTDELKRSVSGDTVVLRLDDDSDVRLIGSILGSEVEDLVAEQSVVRFQVAHDGPGLPKILRALAEHDIEPIGAEIRRPTLDDVFLHLTGRSLRDEAA